MQNNCDPLDYDVAVYGTGLVGCLTASALIKRGLRVIQVDPNADYGLSYRTLTLRQIVNLPNARPVAGCVDLKAVFGSGASAGGTAGPGGDSEGDATPEGEGDNDKKNGDAEPEAPLAHGFPLYYQVAPFPAGEAGGDATAEGQEGAEGAKSDNDKNSAEAGQNAAEGGSSDDEESGDTHRESDTDGPAGAEGAKLGKDTNSPPEGQDDAEGGQNDASGVENSDTDPLGMLTQSAGSINVDLWPRVLLRGGIFADFLVDANAHAGLPVVAGRRNVLFAPPGGKKAPEGKKPPQGGTAGAAVHEFFSDKASIFRSAFLQPADRRAVAKFFASCFAADGAPAGRSGDASPAGAPSAALPPRVANVVAGCTLLAAPQWGVADSELAAHVGLFLKFFHSESGEKAQHGPVAYPLFGTGAVVQHLSRLNALNGGHYMLRQSIVGFAPLADDAPEGQNDAPNGGNDDAPEDPDCGPEGQKDSKNNSPVGGTPRGGGPRLEISTPDYRLRARCLVSEIDMGRCASGAESERSEDSRSEEAKLRMTLVVTLVSKTPILDGLGLCVLFAPGGGTPDDAPGPEGQDCPPEGEQKDKKKSPLGGTPADSDGGEAPADSDAPEGDQKDKKKSPVEAAPGAPEAAPEAPMYVFEAGRAAEAAPEGLYLVYLVAPTEAAPAEWSHFFAELRKNGGNTENGPIAAKLRIFLNFYSQFSPLSNVLLLSATALPAEPEVNIYGPGGASELHPARKVCLGRVALGPELAAARAVAGDVAAVLAPEGEQNPPPPEGGDFLAFGAQDDESVDLSCDFLTDLINKFFG